MSFLTGWPRNNQKPKTTGKMKFKKSESVVGENQNHQTPWEHEVEVSPREPSPKHPGDPSPHSRPQDGMQKCGEWARVPWAATHSWARAPVMLATNVAMDSQNRGIPRWSATRTAQHAARTHAGQGSRRCQRPGACMGKSSRRPHGPHPTWVGSGGA